MNLFCIKGEHNKINSLARAQVGTYSLRQNDSDDEVCNKIRSDGRYTASISFE
jgi:hypothetical protein